MNLKTGGGNYLVAAIIYGFAWIVLPAIVAILVSFINSDLYLLFLVFFFIAIVDTFILRCTGWC
jgi:hypothetical protein